MPWSSLLGWLGVLALAWLAGEAGHRLARLPRLSLYGVIGFVIGPSQLGWLSDADRPLATLVANIAFGLVLFEFGYRVNWRWFRVNRWLALTGLLESGLTFCAVLATCLGADMPPLVALLVATLGMSTSPATLLRVVNEERGAGQVTERMLHLTAMNTALSVLLFRMFVGAWQFQSTAAGWRAAIDTGIALAASVLAGAALGAAAAWLLRLLPPRRGDATVPLALAVAFLVTAMHLTRYSPVLATLSFGFVTRHWRVAFSQAQRDFGPLGDVLTVMLFVFVASTLELPRIVQGVGLGALLLAVRAACKVAGTTLLAVRSGTTVRKGVLTGIGMTPISVFVILLLEQARYLGIDIVDQLAPLAALTAILELAGPLATRLAIVQARESARAPGD
jgi:Kef-type K+ transport system membrane component KefB